jgi:hypothetical protein
MKAIDGIGKIRLLFALFLSILIFQGGAFAQSKSNNGDNSDKQNNAYNRVARDLTSKLSKRVNLTKDQIGKVHDILVDYQKDIADKWNKNSADITGSKDNGSDDYRDADKKANDKIEKALSGNEISSYINVKKDGWAKIKDKVYSRNFLDQVIIKDQDRDNNVGSSKRSSDNDNSEKNDKTASTSGNQDQNAKFEPFAKQMATELMQKLNLSLQQAADVQDALIDYQKSIVDIRQKDSDHNRDNNVRVANNDRNRDNRSENVGSSKDNRMSEFRDIDDSANDKIEKVFDNDNQKTKYEKVKKQWWKEVKDKVFANVQRENRSMTSNNK